MKHILLIDDDEKTRQVFDRYFTAQGYQINCAVDGREGLRVLESELPDLVITDIIMPEVDGMEVLLYLHEKHPELPVIAMSGGSSLLPMDLLPRMEGLWPCKAFCKPVDFADLLVCIRELLPKDGT